MGQTKELMHEIEYAKVSPYQVETVEETDEEVEQEEARREQAYEHSLT